MFVGGSVFALVLNLLVPFNFYMHFCYKCLLLSVGFPSLKQARS